MYWFDHQQRRKLVEVFEENKKLYERLLQAEREKVQLMQQMLDKK